MKRYTPKVAAAVVSFAAIAFLAFVGCDTRAERIREINEILTTPAAERTPISAKIDAIEVRDGDCINSTLPEGISIETVVIVPCVGQWQYRVINSFSLPDDSDYPGERVFVQQASKRCDRRFTHFLFPQVDAWDYGDRTVNCIQDNFGLSNTDTRKLDRLVSYDSLVSGECFNEAPETDDLLVELVSCSGAWGFQVLKSFDVADSDGYPGYSRLSQEADEGCGQGFNFFRYPSKQSWDYGDRMTLCLERNRSP